MSSKVVIAIDFDEVLFDLIGGLRCFIQENFPHMPVPNDIDLQRITSDGSSTLRTAFLESPIFADLHVLPGAVDAMKRLHDAGHSLVAITARPPCLQQATRALLDKHFPGMISSLYFTSGHPKGSLCKSLGVGLIIDDSPINMNDCVAHGLSAVLFGKYSWNQGAVLPPNAVHLYQWTDVVEWIVHQCACGGFSPPPLQAGITHSRPTTSHMATPQIATTSFSEVKELEEKLRAEQTSHTTDVENLCAALGSLEKQLCSELENDKAKFQSSKGASERALEAMAEASRLFGSLEEKLRGSRAASASLETQLRSKLESDESKSQSSKDTSEKATLKTLLHQLSEKALQLKMNAELKEVTSEVGWMNAEPKGVESEVKEFTARRNAEQTKANLSEDHPLLICTRGILIAWRQVSEQSWGFWLGHLRPHLSRERSEESEQALESGDQSREHLCSEELEGLQGSESSPTDNVDFDGASHASGRGLEIVVTLTFLAWRSDCQISRAYLQAAQKDAEIANLNAVRGRLQSEQELCTHATLQAQLQQSQASLQILAAENESLKQSLKQSQASLQMLAAENQSLKQSQAVNISEIPLPSEWAGQEQAYFQSECANNTNDVSAEGKPPTLVRQLTSPASTIAPAGQANQQNTNFLSPRMSSRLPGRNTVSSPQRAVSTHAPAGQVNQQNTNFLSPRMSSRLPGRNTVSSPQRAMFHPIHGCLQSGATHGHSYSPIPCRYSQYAT